MVLKKEIADQIKDLLQKNPHGLSITDIVESVKINRNTAGRYLENLLISGQVELRRFGMAKIYTISQRVPLSAVLSISAELVVQLDSFLRIIFANEAFCELVGTDSKNLVGKNIEYTPVALVFDELFVGFIERIREGVAGIEWSGEIELTSKGIIVFYRIAPTVFDDGRRGVSIILEDITRRKQGERALLESEATARALMNSPTDTVILMDTHGIILDLNDTAAIKFKKYGDDLIGKMADTLLPKEVAQSRRKLTTRVIEKKQMVRYEDERDGRWFDTVAYPIIVNGEVTRIAMIARDITDRKMAEYALRESEERYRQLVEISPDAVIIHQEGKITYLNPAAMRMLRAKDANELLGKKVLDLIHPDYREAVLKNIEKDLDDETTPPLELHMIRVDGSMVIVEGRGVKTTMNGKPAIQVAIRDITEPKRLEMELRESEEKYRTLINRANDGICVVQEGVIKMCNPRLPEIWGGSDNEIIGRPFTDFVHPDALSDIIDKYKRRISGESLHDIYETTLMHKDGSRSFVEVNAGAILYEGKTAGLITIRDINKRKKAEDTLRESEKRLRLVLDNTDDIIIMQDPEGRYLYFNPAARYGVSMNEMIGSTPHDFIDSESADRLVERVKTVAETGQGIREESPIVWKGQTLWFSDSLSPVRDTNGTVTAVVTVSQNITERRCAEMALRESEATARALINAPTDSVVLLDTDGVILALNENAAKRFGKRPDELIGVLPDDLLPEEVVRLRRSLISKIFETKTMVRFEDERDGRWFDTVVYPILDQEGDVIKIAIVARDITERRNTEKTAHPE